MNATRFSKTRGPAIIGALTLTLLVGCGTPTASTPTPPNSPVTQAHNVNKTLADSINAAVKTAIAMRDQGKLSPATTKQIEDWAVQASVVSDNVEMELNSTTDTWTVQRTKIVILLAGFRIPNTGPIETTVQAALTSVQTLLIQFQMQVAQ